MQPMRRRKKRPNYGVRCVEVCRGKNGFGFTISGQQPCILSCIVANSPAEQAGLRPGDYLIAVGGKNVSKIAHDDVVQLIGSCYGVLKLQIAENYYSDSSEEDFITNARQKSKYPNKNKNIGQSSHTIGFNKMYKLRDTAVGNEIENSYTHPLNSANMAKMMAEKKIQSGVLPFVKNYADANAVSNTETDFIYQCVVGYLGTIEMPRKLTPVSRLQIVKGCIKRLRAEKRNYTSVMMTIFPCSLRLKNDSGVTIAVYPGGRVTYCSAHSEQNKKYFGVVTTSLGEDPSNSCHVFVTLSSSHIEHQKESCKFKIECSTDDAGFCGEFPLSSDPIINGVRKYYENNRRSIDCDEPMIANSPQPSNDSTTTSNSDSGIGFRDDSGHQSDRILVVDIQNQRLHIQAAGQSNPQYVDCIERIPVSDNSENTSSISHTSHSMSFQAHHFNINDRRWSFEHDPKNRLLYKSGGQTTGNDICVTCPDIDPIYQSTDDISIQSSHNDALLLHKRDVNHSYDVSQSLEDLKTQNVLYEELEPPKNVRNHSLQNIVSACNIENDPPSPSCTEEQQSQQFEQKEMLQDVSRVGSWATSLEKLLQDNVGIHVFAEFLKKEFSKENIYFWVACEKFSAIEDIKERKKVASQIFQKYLANNATDPVNVDSICQQSTQQQLQQADTSLFSNAQKQIFNLMKFDCYPRFLKSDVYKDLLTHKISGDDVLQSQLKLDPELEVYCAEKTHDPATKDPQEEIDKQCRGSRRRRSLMPWSRSRCKSRDRTSNENVSSGGSRTSLASWDLALPVTLCRIILPDASTAVLNIQTQQTVGYLVTKLLEKRSLPAVSFQVTLTSTNKVVNLEENAMILSGTEVKVEWRVEFVLDLPDRKSLTIKSKPSHSLGAVLAPILLKHGYSLQMVTLCLMSENEVLEPAMLVSVVDRQRVQVLTRSTPIPHIQGWNFHEFAKPPKPATLEEITNRVFEELLHGKAENYKANPTTDAQASIHSEEWGSEHSSGILGRFLRRDSVLQDKQRKNKKFDTPNTSEKKHINKLQPVVAKWKPGGKLDAHFEKDLLYEGLKRAQRGRLEDQRGTEINMELPDFLKTDKENAPCGRKKLRKIRKDFFMENKKEQGKISILGNENVELAGIKRLDDYVSLENCCDQPEVNNELGFIKGPSESSLRNNSQSAENLFSIEENKLDKIQLDKGNSIFRCEPPPLPPKPKNIPYSWRLATGSKDFYPATVYLDQPTSSFV